MTSAPSCPLCNSVHRQAKNGKTHYGSQKYHCPACRKTYNPNPRKQGYPPEMRQKALQLYVDGLNFRRIARLLKVNHQSIINWINAHHAALPAPSDISRDTAQVIEMDELFTFVGTKKAPPMS